MTIVASSVAMRPVEQPTTRQYIRYLFQKVRPTWCLPPLSGTTGSSTEEMTSGGRGVFLVQDSSEVQVATL